MEAGWCIKKPPKTNKQTNNDNKKQRANSKLVSRTGRPHDRHWQLTRQEVGPRGRQVGAGIFTQQKKEKCLLWKVACETSMQPGEKQRNQSDETKRRETKQNERNSNCKKKHLKNQKSQRDSCCRDGRPPT